MTSSHSAHLCNRLSQFVPVKSGVKRHATNLKTSALGVTWLSSSAASLKDNVLTELSLRHVHHHHVAKHTVTQPPKQLGDVSTN